MQYLLWVVLVLVEMPKVFASETSMFLEPALEIENELSRKIPRADLSPAEIFSRSQRVFHNFQVPFEPDFQPELNSVRFETSASDFAKLKKVLDPANQFSRFFAQAANQLMSFADRDSKSLPEYRIQQARKRIRPRPLRLAGLRVALDPGHMGGDIWDKRTGKYVVEGKLKVSEGLIALQTALLMEAQLRSLGAEVLVTHRKLAPVTNMKYEDLSIQDFGRRELRNKSLAAWFQGLISSSSSANLEKNFRNSAAVKKIFSENARSDYFAMREDLAARELLIKQFKPDLTVIIHFDADQENPNPKVSNRTRSYVPGALGADEYATGESRARFLNHLARGEMWKQSVRLSQFITTQISQDLKVPMPESDVKGSVRVVTGVFARNLALTRVLTNAPLSFQEALYYGNPEEFRRLARTDGGSMMIDGKSYSYSRRLADLARAMSLGVVKYVQSTN